jgi:hypothetical protein
MEKQQAGGRKGCATIFAKVSLALIALWLLVVFVPGFLLASLGGVYEESYESPGKTTVYKAFRVGKWNLAWVKAELTTAGVGEPPIAEVEAKSGIFASARGEVIPEAEAEGAGKGAAADKRERLCLRWEFRCGILGSFRRETGLEPIRTPPLRSRQSSPARGAPAP